MKNYLFIFLFGILFSTPIFSQETDNLGNNRENALDIFIDCSYFCDMSFIKNNMTMVNYLRDMKDADVYIRIVSQGTGSGGSELTMFFEGQHDFEGQKNNIIYTTEATSTSDERRNLMVRNLKAGLMPFIAQTPLFKDISISYEEPEEKETTEVKDKWNNWVYNIGVNGYFNGESTSNGVNLYGNISARRVTEKWKISLRTSGNFSRDKYVLEYDDDDNPVFFVVNRNGYGFYSYVIRGVNNHWSVGGDYSVSASSYGNIGLANRFSGAIEYNLFPYEKSAEKQLRFSYRPGYTYNVYADTTIYNKKYEHLGRHRLGIAYETQAKWGSVETSISANQYFHDPSLYSLRLYAGLNVRIVKGLQFRISGNVGLIRNQIALLKGGASDTDILTQQRELATNYDYWGNFGINYSFGSIYNNVVFPRFGGGL